MSNVIKVLVGTLLYVALLSPVSAAVYEASSLHDSVGRSETVQDLFFERWSSIMDRQQYFDMYGKINWVPGFKVRATDRSTGADKTVKMRLVRTYGSMTINYPVVGGYEDGIDKRLKRGSSSTGTTAKDDGTAGAKSETEEPTGLVSPKNLILGFTMTGFHYGLTRKTEVDRGNAGSDSATDYKYTQFFDDMFALSVLYMPYLYVHGGVIINNQIDPNDDGTMSYGKSRDGFPQKRFFVASNFLSFINCNATTTSGKMEKIGGSLEITKFAGMLKTLPAYTPRVTVGYKLLRYYNDKGYESVWVGSPTTSTGADKSSYMSDSEREHAKLHTYSILVEEDVSNIFLVDYYVEFQHCGRSLYDKRTNDKIDLAAVREMRGCAGINFFGFDKTNESSLVFKFGLSRFWDPGVAVQREKGSGYSVNGWLASIKLDHPIAGIEFMVNYNYSKELRKLIEAADKYAIEGSLFVRI
ncbi:MAG TPA: hypothetical protein PKK43_10020 [Spirochaetota bacterium]|nr:hypothetical protein [Spirochaetota bacterium]